ncbi:MAG: hypothetical protein QXV89_02790 [Candidatus Bathyarchaeia archaeon]
MIKLLAMALPILALWIGSMGVEAALLSAVAIAMAPSPQKGRLGGNAWRAIRALGAIALLALALSSAPTRASVITEYVLAGDPRPLNIDVDRGGAIWFAEELANRIGRLSGSTFTEWPIPTVGGTPWGIAASVRGSDGRTYMETLPNGTRGIWFTERFGRGIGLLVPARNGIYEWQLPSGSEPRGIVVGYNSSSGKPITWVADYGNGKIYKFYSTRDSGTIAPSEWTLVEYSVPDNAKPVCIATAYPGDAVWFTCPEQGKVGRLNHWTGVFMMYTVGGRPWGIAIDPDGKVWYTDQDRNAICQLDPANGLVTEIKLPNADSEPWAIAIDWGQYAKYDVWFTERRSHRIGRYVPGTGALMEYRTPLSISYPTGLAMDDSGYVWFTEATQPDNRIARLNQRVGPTSYTTLTTFSTSTHSTTTANTMASTIATATTPLGALASSSVSTTMSGAGTVTYSTVTDNKTVFVITAPITVTRTSTIPLGTTTETREDTLTTTVQTWSTTTTTTTSATLTSFISTTTTTLTIPGTFEVIQTGTTTTTWYYATTALVNYTVTTTATATTTSTLTLTSWATAIAQATSTTLTTATVTTTVSTTATPSGGLAIPGFEAPSVLAGLGAGAALLRLCRQRRGRDAE